MLYYPESHNLDIIIMAEQSILVERFEELPLDYMRGFVDYYYGREVGKITGWMRKYSPFVGPPIIVGAMSKQIKIKESFERKNHSEIQPYREGYIDSFIFFNEELARMICIDKEKRPSFLHLEQARSRPLKDPQNIFK